jgi:tripartite-type tricarboxylate transporter receptor subunit TctC
LEAHVRLIAAALSVVLAAVAPASAAQDYPSKPIKLVVPFIPGGTSEVLARGLAKTMEEGLKQNIVIENIGGAGSTLGSAAVARAAPDGYTLLFGYSSGLTIAPGLYGNLPYDSVSSFTPIGTVARFFMVMVAHNSVPANNLKELVDYAKKNPGKVTYGSAGVGSSIHLLGEVFKKQAGIDITHVPYKGMRPALLDLVAGRVDLAWDATDALTPLIKAGRIKPLAVMAPKRLAEYPNVPTVHEEGYPELGAFVWTALMAPAGLPRPIAARLESELARAQQSPELQKIFLARGYEMFSNSPAQLTELIRTEIPRWTAVVKSSGAKVE